jgi:hypothetical protein
MGRQNIRSRTGVGVAILSLLLTGASPPDEERQRHGARAEHRNPLPPAPMGKPVSRGDARSCEQADYRVDGHLCAEWRTVRATEKAADAALWSLFLSVAGSIATMIGTALVLLTFRETRRTAQIAEDGLTEARRSANAALEQAAISRTAMEQQLRPYVYLTLIVPEYGHMRSVNLVADAAALQLEIQNFGATPAKNVTFRARGFVGGYWSGPVDGALWNEVHVPLGDLPVGFTKEVRGYTIIGIKAADQDLIAGTASLFFVGEIAYDLADGTRRLTKFQLAASGDDYERGRFQVTPDGNIAT